MRLNRRQFLTALGSNAAARAGVPPGPALRVILLGTKGGPTLASRSNPATLLLVNDIPYVVDCGYGVSRQLISAGVALDRLRYVFLTHHHSDHNLEFGPLLYNAWVTPKPVKIDAYGPPGLHRLTNAFFAYQKFDIETRIADEGMIDLRKVVAVHEFKKAGLVMQNEDVKVTSLQVRHPPIAQAYAYRFEAKDRCVVISGDTAYLPEMAQFAKGADVLVHEAMYVRALDALIEQTTNASRLREHLLLSHTSTEDVGRIAAAAGVRTLVLSHLVPGGDASITDEQWTEGPRKYFKGRIIVGRDLMEM
jgi:ribonuclease BN (tRNA processing enzyme)